MSLLRTLSIAVALALVATVGPTLDTVVAAHATATAAQGAGAPSTSHGNDISWPQCGGAYPTNPAFGIVGVNKGIVFSANPCLASEISWAGGSKAQLYANTGNPGPALSSHWPMAQTVGTYACNPTKSTLLSDRDTVACAYVYGYNAAADSYANAMAAFSANRLTGSPATSAWWLDVETGNSWRSDTSLNVYALQGEADYFVSVVGVAKLGIYSTQYQWNQIAGGSLAFSADPSWVAGASSQKAASSRCTGLSFTGGGVALAQYSFSGFDADVAC
jgi:hypothetical protein